MPSTSARPRTSLFDAILRHFDLNQSQFLDVETYSQEFRYTSPTEGRFRWIAGAYFIHTDRFISTGNMVDTGDGRIPPAVSASRARPATNPERDLPRRLAGQRRLGGVRERHHRARRQGRARPRGPLRRGQAREHDRDARGFLPLGTPPGSSGQVRSDTWSETQPKITLRYEPMDTLTLYGGWSRGFRSGGFNQTGVGAVADASGIAGVNDLFEAEVAETTEIGVKSEFADGRASI